ncbi:MAG: cupin [Patescibacteria group bacterium]
MSESQESYVKKVPKPWGHEIHWVPDGFPYMGKILHLDAGKQTSLQRHNKKQESWFLMQGEAKIIWDNPVGEMVETMMLPGQGYSCAIGQKHRLMGVTDCDIIEISTPEIGITERLEDDYQRPDETEEMRKLGNRGWGDHDYA